MAQLDFQSDTELSICSSHYFSKRGKYNRPPPRLPTKKIQPDAAAAAAAIVG